MWSPVVHTTLNDNRPVPKTRSKHASCLVPDRRAIFLLGGRCSTVPLRDFWTFDLDSGLWTSLLARGTPVNVQEHSMIHWNDCLYVFGGVFAQAGECPLWIYQIQTGAWEQWQSPKGHNAPQSRKAHTAVTYGNAMYIYGGYQDMRGSLSELWQFSFEANQWKMWHGNEAKKPSELIPPARHRHSAVVFDQGMWIYGGMTDLQDRSDLWRLDLVSKRWSPVKCKFGPGPLHSHSAVCVHSCMLIVGGEKQGDLSDEVWRFHFGTETWERIETFEPKPTARTQLTAVTLTAPLFMAKRTDLSSSALSSQQQHQQHQNANSDMIKMRNGGCLGKPRPPLFSRKSAGYQLVETDETFPGRQNAAWLAKSGPYALLSNATSTDSCAVNEDDGDDGVSLETDTLPNMVRSRPVHQIRSESAYNFIATSPSCPTSSVPRSQTTTRLNPFIRSETFDVTTSTSDYASEVGDPSFTGSVIGIPNPVYDEFSFQRDEEHRSFALALNNSLSKNNRRRRNDTSSSQMVRLQPVVEPLRSAGDNVIHPSEDEERRQAFTPPRYDQEVERCCWSVLILGGREAGHVPSFDRPLSIWMLRF